MEIKCPACQKNLHKLYVTTIEVDVCEDGCKGIWFDNGELNIIKDLKYSAIAKEIEGQYDAEKEKTPNEIPLRNCPHCRIKMKRYNWALKSDIYVDICHTCYGTWLDYGELKGIKLYKPVTPEEKNKINYEFIEQAEPDEVFAAEIHIKRNEVKQKRSFNARNLFKTILSMDI
jgi:Zn-finger nucleic acid-binding protein